MSPDPAPEIDWKVESRRFDTVPEDYEAYRPGYPDGLIEAIVGETRLAPDGKILEIGSGTGKGTEPFVKRGYSVLCIEPGKHLADVAAAKFKDSARVQFANCAFEDWALSTSEFDLAISAQAFHWIDKTGGFPKIARALKPGGWLAVWWNRPVEESTEIWLELDQVYRERALSIRKDPGRFEETVEGPRNEINASGLFGPVKVLRFPWSTVYTVSQYLGLLHTYSDHLRLEASTNSSLYEGVAEVINRHGGVIEKRYIAVLYLAQV